MMTTTHVCVARARRVLFSLKVSVKLGCLALMLNVGHPPEPSVSLVIVIDTNALELRLAYDAFHHPSPTAARLWRAIVTTVTVASAALKEKRNTPQQSQRHYATKHTHQKTAQVPK